MKEFKYYTTKEKWQVVFEYFLSIVLPILIVVGYIYFINNQTDYKKMIDYKTEVNNLVVNSVSKDEVLEASVKVINKNIDVPFYLRFKFNIDDNLLKDVQVHELLKPVNTKDRLIIREGNYYYLEYKKTNTNLLFDQIKWLDDRVTAKGMDFSVKVEAIPATKVAVNKKWIKREELTNSNAYKLNYLR